MWIWQKTLEFSLVVLPTRLHTPTEHIYTVGHKKEPTHFFCNFVKNKRILIQFLLLDLQMNVTCDGMTFTHLT